MAIFITFSGSPVDAVSYVSVVLDACELSPSPQMLSSVFSLSSSFTVVSLSPRSSTVGLKAGEFWIEISWSLARTGDDSQILSTSNMVEIDAAAAIVVGSDRLINGAGTIDLRPEIGSNLSSIESRGLI